MPYANQSVTTLLRGPLLRSPQGWTVLFTAALYALIAMAFLFELITPPNGKDRASVLVISVAWPFIIFLQFVKQNLPDFLPSWKKAAFLAISALAPIVYASLPG